MSHIQPDTTLPKTPRIRVYTALLTQSGTAAPTAIILQNTLEGTIVWSRVEAGNYAGTLNGAFTENKTAGFLSPIGTQTQVERTNNNVFTVYTSSADGQTGEDSWLNGKAMLEIKVYE